MNFEFTRNGITYRVSTRVGEGLADVVVQEDKPAEAQMEVSE